MASYRKRNGKWQVQVRHHNLGSISKTFTKKEYAKKWVLEREIAHFNNHYQDEVSSNTTLENMMRRYLKEVTPTKRGHAPEERRLQRLLKENELMEKKLRTIKPHDFAKFRDKRLKQGARTCHYDLVLLRHAWNIARIEWGWNLGANPVSLIRFPRLNPPRERRLKLGELERLQQENKKSKVWYLWPIIQIALETGMRRGEILSIEWRNVDFERKQVLLPLTKNGYARIVPLNDFVISIIQEIPKSSEEIFPITDNAFRQAWQRLRSRANLDDLKFHDLRHEAISIMFENGMSIPQVKATTGHRTVSQLFRYVQII